MLAGAIGLEPTTCCFGVCGGLCWPVWPSFRQCFHVSGVGLESPRRCCPVPTGHPQFVCKPFAVAYTSPTLLGASMLMVCGQNRRSLGRSAYLRPTVLLSSAFRTVWPKRSGWREATVVIFNKVDVGLGRIPKRKLCQSLMVGHGKITLTDDVHSIENVAAHKVTFDHRNGHEGYSHRKIDVY